MLGDESRPYNERGQWAGIALPASRHGDVFH